MNWLLETEISRLWLKNKIVRAATHDSMSNPDDSVSEKEKKMYSELARNEVALIISGFVYPSLNGKATEKQNSLCSEIDAKAWSEVSKIVHNYGSKMMIQINYAGRRGYQTCVDLNKLELDEIALIKRDFVNSAWLAKQANMDGVQIHCAHGYLLADFLSEYQNHREDCYGGSLENRFRIVAEIVKDIKHICGEEYPVCIKLDSNTNKQRCVREDLLGLAKLCKEAGIWAIEISGDNHREYTIKEHIYYLEAAQKIKEVVDIPVILVGGIRSKEDIDVVLSAGIDLVSLARPFICEPNLIMQFKLGKSSQCISCGVCRSIYLSKGKRCVLHD